MQFGALSYTLTPVLWASLLSHSLALTCGLFICASLLNHPSSLYSRIAVWVSALHILLLLEIPSAMDEKKKPLC